MRKIVMSIVVLGLCSMITGCSSPQVRMGPRSGKDYTVIGKAEGEGTGLMLFQLIPIRQNSRFQTAYNEAVRNGGGDDLVNLEISERWFWAYVLNGYVTHVQGDVIKYKNSPDKTEAEIPAAPK